MGLSHLPLTGTTQAILERLAPRLEAVLARTANPDRGLANLSRLVQNLAGQPELLSYLAEAPRALEVVATLFASSQFLSEILLRNPGYLTRLVPRSGGLSYPDGLAPSSGGVAENGLRAEIKSRRQFDQEAQWAMAAALRAAVQPDDGAAAFDALRRFQHWELLRIGVCDFTGLLDLASVTSQLSDLADSVVSACLKTLAQALGLDLTGFAVLALGKLGGRELNYSSDIDLLFIARANATIYRRLGERLIAVLTQPTAEGFLYRVDMRLRPWGRVGPLVSTLDGYLAYLRQHARLWEKQALLKARPVAGDEGLGKDFLSRAMPFLFSEDPETVRSQVHAMKQRTEARLREQGKEWGEVKLGVGSIRDIEFVTQYLQLVHGGRAPQVRGGNTLEALSRLAEAGILCQDDYRVLVEGYIFLRTVEHYLQILDYRQTHSLPEKPWDLHYLAQRLGFQGEDAEARLITRYQQYTAAIRDVYQRHLGGVMPSPGSHRRPNPLAGADGRSQDPAPAGQEAAQEAVRKHLARMAPSYAATFSEAEIQHHAALAARLSPDNPIEVTAEPLGEAHWRVTIVGYDYLGELSLICGLLFVHGFSIIDGHVYTYEPRAQGEDVNDTRQKIVDVFTVRSVLGEVEPDLWLRYAAELADLVRLLQMRRQREAQGELAKRVAVAVRRIPGTTATLHPVNIEIDNETSEQYTILRIDAPDTIGFLYEFTNALALNGVYIAQVSVASVGNRVRDTLYVTDARGRKIIAADKQRELRAATVLVKHFTHLLPQSPNPESALLHFHEYLGQLFEHPGWPDELASLERPEVLNALARLLGVSDFLWEDFLRMQYANLFPVVHDVDGLKGTKSREQLAAELAEALRAAPDPMARRDALNAFKDREMFRVDMRHILGHISQFGQFSAELTTLAEVVVDAAYHLCDAELRSQYGEPCLEDGRPCPLTICGLGKCGGRELGFASDIELMFIYAGNGKTSGPQVITTAEYYEKLVMEVVRAIRARREGIFEIDLQLRPYGSAGSLAVSLESFRRYFAPDGAAWSYERQALIKLRPIAGDAGLGREVERLRDEYVYCGRPFDVPAMRAMRERQIRHLVTPGTINAKFSPGGLVDLEYIVQGLQVNYGHLYPQVRLTNTREAMAALAEVGIISAENYARLREAHIFLRRLINALRMVRGNARDLTVPPEDSEEFAFLARRLGYDDEPLKLRADLTHHITWVQRLSTRLLG